MSRNKAAERAIKRIKAIAEGHRKQFNKSHKFEFFFAYCALKRAAEIVAEEIHKKCPNS